MEFLKLKFKNKERRNRIDHNGRLGGRLINKYLTLIVQENGWWDCGGCS